MQTKHPSPVTTFTAISQLPSSPPNPITIIDEPGQPQIIIQIEDTELGSPGHPSDDIREVANSMVLDVPTPFVDSSPSNAPSSPIHSPSSSSSWDESPLSSFLPWGIQCKVRPPLPAVPAPSVTLSDPRSSNQPPTWSPCYDFWSSINSNSSGHYCSCYASPFSSIRSIVGSAS